MVKGLDRLRSYFEQYTQNYIIIGGTACEIRLESRGIDFRATKDVDMLIIIEAINNEFLEAFWQLIRDGEYINRNKRFLMARLRTLKVDLLSCETSCSPQHLALILDPIDPEFAHMPGA